MTLKRLVNLLVFVYVALGFSQVQAQSLHTAVSTQMKITDHLNATAHLSSGTYDKLSGVSKYALSVSASYTFGKHLTFAAGTAIVMHHGQEKELDDDQIRPSFWQPRWRTFISISPKISFLGFNAFYRTRFQALLRGNRNLTLIPSGDNYFLDGETTLTWAHRIYAEHPLGKFTPYVSFDLFNSLDNKLKVTHYQVALGTYYFITPKHRLGLFGRKIFRPDGTKTAEGNYVIGLTYQFRFTL